MIRTELCEELHSMLDRIVKLNKERRRTVPNDMEKVIGEESYAREYCTIRFDIGRQCGKSEWIKRRATKDDLVIILKAAYKGFFRDCKADVKSMHEVSRDRHTLIRGTMKYKTVYIDEPMFTCKKISFEEILPFLINERLKEQTFILLGM